MVTNTIKQITKNIQYKYNTSSSERFIKFLRKKGIFIGDGCTFYEPRTITIDQTRPSLISIGNNVKITKGVTILTHGADWHVLRELYHEPFGSAGKVTIKDNVFIGMHSIILKGVTINESSIIGAGSIVPKDIPPGTVAAGNPAKPIMSIHDYYIKRVNAQIDEACEYARSIKETYNRLPVPEDFREFFFLFIGRDPKGFENIPVKKQLGAYYDEFLKSKPHFDNFEVFLKYCKLI